MTTLFRQSDDHDLIAQLPPAFMAEFRADDVAKRLPGWCLKTLSRGELAACEYLRRVWNRAFDGLGNTTYVLTDGRVDQVRQRLRQGFRVVQIALAIRAYAEECKSPWYVKRSTARRTFEDFLKHDRFDLYVCLGDKQAARHQAMRQQAAVSMDKSRVLAACAGAGRDPHQVQRAAYLRLTNAGQVVEPATLDNPILRAAMMEELKGGKDA